MNIILAENAGGGAGGGQQPGAGLDQLLIMVVPMILIFYFLFIRPENKRRKQWEAMLNEIKPKDKVITKGGIVGTVVEIDKDEMVLLVDPKKDVKLRFRRAAVEMVEHPEEKEKK
jgi:preprotein translocase subunit YajC